MRVRHCPVESIPSLRAPQDQSDKAEGWMLFIRRKAGAEGRALMHPYALLRRSATFLHYAHSSFQEATVLPYGKVDLCRSPLACC